MHILNLLALVCFLAATIWSAILKSWPMALLSAGASLLVIEGLTLT